MTSTAFSASGKLRFDMRLFNIGHLWARTVSTLGFKRLGPLRTGCSGERLFSTSDLERVGDVFVGLNGLFERTLEICLSFLRSWGKWGFVAWRWLVQKAVRMTGHSLSFDRLDKLI